MHCSAYREEEGSLLDLAFRDRLSMWNGLRLQHGVQVERTFCAAWSFLHEGKIYPAPGRYNPRLLRSESFDLNECEAGNGPDGKGPDALIQNAEVFNSSVTEVVSQLRPSKHSCGRARSRPCLAVC